MDVYDAANDNEGLVLTYLLKGKTLISIKDRNEREGGDLFFEFLDGTTLNIKCGYYAYEVDIPPK